MHFIQWGQTAVTFVLERVYCNETGWSSQGVLHITRLTLVSAVARLAAKHQKSMWKPHKTFIPDTMATWFLSRCGSNGVARGKGSEWVSSATWLLAASFLVGAPWGMRTDKASSYLCLFWVYPYNSSPPLLVLILLSPWSHTQPFSLWVLWKK